MNIEDLIEHLYHAVNQTTFDEIPLKSIEKQTDGVVFQTYIDPKLKDAGGIRTFKVSIKEMYLCYSCNHRRELHDSKGCAECECALDYHHSCCVTCKDVKDP